MASAERDSLVRELEVQRNRVAQLEAQVAQILVAADRVAFTRAYPSDTEIAVRCGLGRF